MNKKYKVLGIIGLVLILGIVGLSRHATLQKNRAIGALIPLTGTSASIGERVKIGMEIAQEELRETGSPLKIIYEDDKGDAPTSVSAARKLIDADHTHIIIGPLKSDAMLAVAPIAEEKHIILLSPTAGAEAISQAGDYIFRNIESPTIHGEAAAAYMIERAKKVAVFTAQASNAQSYGTFFKEHFESRKGIIAYSYGYNQNDIDFRTEITKAQKINIDGVYIAVATAKDAGIITRQFREQSFKGLIMVSIAADAKEFFATAGTYAEGIVITSSFFDSQSSVGKKFNDAYRTKTGKDADGFAANGYDAVMLIAEGIKTCAGDSNTNCIRDFLYATKNYNGAGGILTFDAHGDVAKPVLIKIARNGAFIPQ